MVKLYSVQETVDYLESKFDVLKTAIHLDVSLKDDHELEGMNAALCEVESQLNQMKIWIADEHHEISSSCKVLDMIKHEKTRLQHILANLPTSFVQATTVKTARPCPDLPAVQNTASPAVPGNVAGPLRNLSASELATVPTYMRGRITPSQITQFVELFNRVLAGRRALLRRPRSQLSASEKHMWLACRREVAADNKGKLFVSEADFKRFSGVALSRVQHQIVVVLRHCARLRHVRVPGATVCYVVL